MSTSETGPSQGRKITTGIAMSETRPNATDVHWKCGQCSRIVTAKTPPEKCPACGEVCDFKNVTCYTPECGGPGNIDPRL